MKTKPNGFTLIEVIISVTLLSFVSLLFADFLFQQKKSIFELEDQLEKVEIVRNLETVFRNGLACQQTIAGAIVPAVGSTNITDIKDNSGAVLYSSNTIVNNLTLGQITLTNDTVPGPSSSGFVDISIPVMRTRPGTYFRNIDMKINVTVNAARAVTSCSSTASLAGYYSCDCTSWYWRGSVISPADMSGQLCYRPNGCAGGCHTASSTWACTPL
jgi:prepilin-type N-terminal cleavage/methylation domain-containing protein